MVAKSVKKIITIEGLVPEKQLFHNEWIDVYSTYVNFENITYYPKNLRTILSFSLLEKQYQKKILTISLESITYFLADRPDLKIPELARSISKNNIRVPLIILDNGTLLDGNRRYFACAYLKFQAKKKKKNAPKALKHIPVWVIKKDDIDDKKERKILAEANFVPDFKVEWTLDVKAQVISEYFESLKKEKKNIDKIYDEILNVYGVQKKIVDEYISSMNLVNEFIESKNPQKQDRCKQIVQSKFVYFWEFTNKTSNRRLNFDPKEEIPNLKDLFFKMMYNDRFKNMKQIEPMVRSIRDDYCWELLVESSGSKINQVEALFKEQKAIKSAEDKIRNFLKWLTNKIDDYDLKSASFKLLDQIAIKCKQILDEKDI